MEETLGLQRDTEFTVEEVYKLIDVPNIMIVAEGSHIVQLTRKETATLITWMLTGTKSVSKAFETCIIPVNMKETFSLNI